MPSRTPAPGACLHSEGMRTRPPRRCHAAARPSPTAVSSPSSSPPSLLPLAGGSPLPDAARSLLKAYSQALHCGVRPPHESVEQTYLDPSLLPDSQALESHTLLRLSTSRVTSSVKYYTSAEVAQSLFEVNNGLGQTLIKLSPSNGLPGTSLLMTNSDPEQNGLGCNSIEVRIWALGSVLIEGIMRWFKRPPITE
jgi:hypothetical protein